jgi:hypothetical protein
LHHLWDAWQRRDGTNVVLLHYADLRADCTTEFARLAEALGIDVTSERLEELAAHGDFARMKARSATVAPEVDNQIWKADTDFFREGRVGAWAKAFDVETLVRYQNRISELYPDEEFLTWVHGGRRGGQWRVDP